jgi:flavin reductase (DIM6/NTAB) family NADH-FMN oxidoreductase RutF
MRCQPTVSFNARPLRYDLPDMIPVTADQFRQVMRRWASTVNIVTTRHEDFDYGLTVTAFSSLAAMPPLVFVSINTHTRTHPLIERSGIFCVNFLSPTMKHISDRFAGRLPDEERFAGLAHRVAITGAPVLNDAIAFLDCKVVQAFAAGDHTIFVGEVLSGDVQHPEQTPLLYFNGKYRGLGGEITE